MLQVVVHTDYVKGPEFVKSPFRYPGGKFYALKYIIPILESVPHTEYREPFIGGGSVFFAKKKAPMSWINDLEKDLITTYKVISDSSQRENLCNRLENEIASRERHAEVKGLIPKTTEDLAHKIFYLNRTSYSGIINKPAWGYKDENSTPPKNWPGIIRAAGNKLNDTQITSLDFEDVIAAPSKGNSVLMYLDPPYFHADQKRAYTKPFQLEDHVRLAKILAHTPYHFCLSYDDCDEIRDLYSWANIYTRQWFYNTANTKGIRKLGNELIISNFRIIHPEQGALFAA